MASSSAAGMAHTGSQQLSAKDDADALLAHARAQFPEDPFADAHAQSSTAPAPPSTAPAPTPSSAAAAAATGPSTGTTGAAADKNPFRALIAQTGPTLGATPSTSAASTAPGATSSSPRGSVGQARQEDGIDLSSLSEELPRTDGDASHSNGQSVPTASVPVDQGQSASSASQPRAANAEETLAAATSVSPSTPVYAPPTGPPPDVASPTTSPAYAPPPGPPSPGRTLSTSSSTSPSQAGTVSSSSSRPAAPPYVPSHVPTPGAPLLRKGKLLVYPPGMADCHKCHNTGYKFDDPTHPCKGCWSRYGESVNSLLSKHGSFDRVPGVLQRPLPQRVGAPGASAALGSIQRPYASSSHHPSASAGYPGAMASTNAYRYMDNVYDPGFGHGLHTPTMPAWLRDAQRPSASQQTAIPAFRPPTGPPPPTTSARPPVNRTDEARREEARVGRDGAEGGTRRNGSGDPTGDEAVTAEGEVPPSYEEAVAASADGRTLNAQHVTPTPSSNRPPPPSQHPSATDPGASGLYSAGVGGGSTFSAPGGPPPLHPPQHHSAHSPYAPYHSQMHAAPNPPIVGPPEAPYGMGPVPNVHYVDSRRRPPPGALVVRPGDPRIGGRLCYNCGGDGTVSPAFLDALFGAPDEQCRVCRGSGRVFS